MMLAPRFLDPGKLGQHSIIILFFLFTFFSRETSSSIRVTKVCLSAPLSKYQMCSALASERGRGGASSIGPSHDRDSRASHSIRSPWLSGHAPEVPLPFEKSRP